MPKLKNLQQADSLYEEWCAAVDQSPERGGLSVLRELLLHHGTHVSLSELRLGFHDVVSPAALGLDGFRDHAITMFGDQDLRRSHAFSYLAGGQGSVSTDVLASRLAALQVTHPETLVEKLDRNGDAIVELADITHAFSTIGAPVAAYRATSIAAHRLGAGRQPERRNAADHVPGRTAVDPVAVSQVEDRDGCRPISPLQMQIAFFRLLQGAAYRSFRESYSANSETHLRARDLPYTVRDFRAFVQAAVNLYLALGLVEGEAARAEFAALVEGVEEACASLDTLIESWPSIEITSEMAAAEREIKQARADEADEWHRLAHALEVALVMKQHGIAPGEMRPEFLTKHELNRMRHLELASEHSHDGAAVEAAATAVWLDSWAAVIVDADGSRRDGSIMPVRFWYEKFMPQLLRCASIRNDGDLDALNDENPETLRAWYDDCVSRGEFDRYATDLRDGFAQCSVRVQQSLKQAWRLSSSYLGGLQKRREREEFGRDTGALSQYVAFIDSYLGRADVANAEMRVSFPYYIGPAVWGLLHTSAELIEAMDDEPRAEAMAAFKTFFRAFATMYPCPYCRYHLNRFVVRNAETQFYPVEFLLHGQKPEKATFDISLDDRLETISPDRPASLRLFVWKLHNAVSSSITRTEAWYHAENDPLYTSRHWPSVDEELARARALGHESVSVHRIGAVFSVAKQSAHLSTLRDEILEASNAGDVAAVSRLADRARPLIASLEGAVDASGFLQSSYRMDSSFDDKTGAFTIDDEAFARSGYFIER